MKLARQLETAFIIIVMYSRDLNSLVTLNTLSVLIILSDRKTETLLWLEETNLNNITYIHDRNQHDCPVENIHFISDIPLGE